jgi:hypothetical protein
MSFKTKSRFESDHFTSVSGIAATQLKQALISDPAHIVPDRMLQPLGAGQKTAALRPIQEALNKLRDKGGFPSLVRISAAEIAAQTYSQETEDAVLGFKRELDIRRPGESEVDPICGRSTLAQLDDAMKKLEGDEVPAPPETPAPSAAEGKFRDVVVNIVGFGGQESRAQGTDIGGAILKSELETPDYKALNRDLTVIGFIGSTDERNPKDKIVKQVEDAFSGHRRGVICMTGGSVGGKNVLQVAAILNEKKFSLRYLGIRDGAFFDPDAQPPKALERTPLVPIIKLPAVVADTRINIFQSLGNGTAVGVGQFRKIWFGKMVTSPGEIHGSIPGWDNRDKADKVKDSDPDTAHAKVESDAFFTQRDDIKEILKNLPKS